MKYHIHIYEVSGLIEKDIEAESIEEARNKALQDTVLQKFGQ